MGNILEVECVNIAFGGVHAVRDVSLILPASGRIGVIGPNGAGKSTLMNLIAGSVRPDSGDVRFDGASITRLPAHRRSRQGIARTFQNLELFVTMTVLENVIAALDVPPQGSSRRHGAHARRRAREALDLMGVADLADVPVGALSYGARKLVELSRALAPEPRLLLLDEPVAGVAEVDHFVEALHRALESTNTAAVVVEHHMPTVRALVDYVYVLDAGSTVAEGTFEEVAKNPRVIEAYLGKMA